MDSYRQAIRDESATINNIVKTDQKSKVFELSNREFFCLS